MSAELKSHKKRGKKHKKNKHKNRDAEVESDTDLEERDFENARSTFDADPDSADGAPKVAAELGNGEVDTDSDDQPANHRLSNKDYEQQLRKLQIELVKLQQWVVHKKMKVVILFEGRDAAGKGGTIKRITESLNPRICRVVALPAPTEREKTQWYFQRYCPHLPAGGEIVILDRSWYNRAGVERVMGFCNEDEYREFLRSCPEFERMLTRASIKLVKYWFSVSNDEQERRFQGRITDPTKRWKLSPMDLESRRRWVDYSMAKDAMFAVTDIKQAPWYVVPSDSKKRARLNCISHLLGLFDYEDLTPKPIELPPRQPDTGYVRPPMSDQTIVPQLH
jgi:polyphosphate kinase 2